jgi:hypothetical protein
MQHILKTWPEFFQAITNGQKNFEIRKNDRGFQSGDRVILKEWDPESMEYTGREMVFKIGFIVYGEWGLKSDYCTFALLPIEEK